MKQGELTRVIVDVRDVYKSFGTLAVSYTHLDVYKRQAFRICAEERRYCGDFNFKAD